jgi:RNA polymerase sigma factor for flagellar operon FliA
MSESTTQEIELKASIFDQIGLNDTLKKHSSLVRRLAHQMISRLPANVELNDLIQVGMIGLADALSKYDNREDVLFETFAVQRIRGAMLDELRQNDYLSRGTRKAQRTIESAIDTLEQKLFRTPTDHEMADQLNLSLEEYQKMRSVTRVLYFEDLHYDNNTDQDFLDSFIVGEETDSAFSNLQNERFEAALEKEIELLPDRERSVMKKYYDDDLTFKEIGTIFGVSESRAYQLHNQAVKRLSKILRYH